MSDKMTKTVVLSQVVEDLHNGLTKWKKDDLGFGSLEKKYNLSQSECIRLFGHPKIVNVESKIPTFIIEDDLPGEPALETRVQVESPVQKPLLQASEETRIETPVRQNVTYQSTPRPVAPVF
jgi:hypothetical protein